MTIPNANSDALHAFITISVYIFIAIVVWTLRSDIKYTQRTITLNTSPAGELINLASEAIHPLMPVTSLGRASTNIIAIADPAISLEHALITRRQGTWWLEDLNSRNGTLLNSQMIVEPTVITSGDIITIGKAKYRVLILSFPS